MFRDIAQQQFTAKVRCRSQLTWAFQRLDIQPTFIEVERCFRLIWSTLSSPSRLFHNAQHVLHLSHNGDAIHVLAALFHDAVYVQVDGGLAAPVQELLKPYLLYHQGELCLKGANALQQGRGSALVAHLFNYQTRTPQLAMEHNELLSALLAMRCLEPFLGWGDLAQIAVAIEASIPFRMLPHQPGQGSPGEQLFGRLQQANAQFGLALNEPTMTRAIHRAIIFANRDVESFATADPAIFLDHTWQLLPEFNPALRNPTDYSVRDYRLALQRMETFIDELEAENIFQQFQQYPDPVTHKSRVRYARQNLSVAKLYLQTKLVAIALLEALGPYYRGGGPMAGWMSPRLNDLSWEDSFGRWSLSHPLTTAAQCQTLIVAEQGRKGDCHFDLNRSPLAAFLIRAIGFERIGQLRTKADALFEERIGPEEFLGQCEAKVVQAVTQRLQPSA